MMIRLSSRCCASKLAVRTTVTADAAVAVVAATAGLPPPPVASAAVRTWAVTTTAGRQLLSHHFSSSSSSSSSSCFASPVSFAVVHHGEAYERAMRGLHGQQLALAQREGEGKDEPDFDPFIEEEMEEARLLAEQEKATTTASTSTKKVVVAEEEEDTDHDKPGSTTSSSSSLSNQYFSTFDHTKYRKDGFLRRNASETAILQAGAPAGGQIAIIRLAGTQFKVTVDDLVICNRLYPPHLYSVGSVHTLYGNTTTTNNNNQKKTQNDDDDDDDDDGDANSDDNITGGDVLLVSNTATTLVGLPYVTGATVTYMVEEITRDAKLTIFKRRKKGLRRKTGFRRDVTLLRILDITMPAPYDTIAPYLVRPDPAPIIETNNRRRQFVPFTAQQQG